MRQRTMLAAAAAAASSCIIAFAIGSPANAATGSVYVSVYRQPGYSTVKVLDIANWSTADRGPAHLWSLRSATGGSEVRNQRWTIVDVGMLGNHRLVKLVNALSGKCLDKSEDRPNANGNAVYQYSCISGANNQVWEQLVNAGTHGWYQLKNQAGGRCLDVAGDSYADGATIHVWDCHATMGQMWNID